MPYERRYMRPFVGTTIVIQDDAITPDKVDDKAIQEKHLAENAVSERAIASAAVTSDEIKDATIETQDLKDASVTEPKLADGAVTEDKLSFTPSTRPLDPAIATEEIADDAVDKDKIGPEAVETPAIKDGAVTADKLAGDAVETVKIKDANVTGAKIEPDTIDYTHLKANSVRGTEIQDGAVSNTKIGTDAVTTIKIQDYAVTLPKLSPDILRDILAVRQFFYDDFLGATFRPEWALSGDPGFLIGRDFSELEMDANPVNGNACRVDFAGIMATSIGENPAVLVRSRQVLTNIHVRFGLIGAATKYVLFDFDTAVDGNWHVKTRNGGAETDINTFIAATNVMHEFKFIFQSTPLVTFSIDGVGVGVSNSNLPTTGMHPVIEVQNRAAATKRLTVDKYILSTEDSVGEPPP